MRFVNVHFLITVNNGCVNRGEDGEPKSCTVGGVQRARISSQCKKYAEREYLRNDSSFNGRYTAKNSTHFHNYITDKLVKLGLGLQDAKKQSISFFKDIGIYDKNEDKLNASRNWTEDECNFIAQSIYGNIPSEEIIKLLINQNNSSLDLNHIYGRMDAKHPKLNNKSCIGYSHLYSVHECYNDSDYFITADNLQPNGEHGASFIGPTQGFNSAVYYGNSHLNLDALKEYGNIDERKLVVKDWLRTLTESFPSGKQTSNMCADTPYYIIATVQKEGNPYVLNAWDVPISSNSGFDVKAKNQLFEYYEMYKNKEGLIEKIISEYIYDRYDNDKSNTRPKLIESILPHVL